MLSCPLQCDLSKLRSEHRAHLLCPETFSDTYALSDKNLDSLVEHQDRVLTNWPSPTSSLVSLLLSPFPNSSLQSHRTAHFLNLSSILLRPLFSIGLECLPHCFVRNPSPPSHTSSRATVSPPRSDPLIRQPVYQLPSWGFSRSCSLPLPQPVIGVLSVLLLV